MRKMTEERRRELHAILDDVAFDNRLEVWEIVSKPRNECYVVARRDFAVRAQDAMYSLPEIARVLNRHHTTVLSLLGPRTKDWKRVMYSEPQEFIMARRWKVRFECGHDSEVVARLDPKNRALRCPKCSKR